jgi:hypothetical protein
MHPANRWHRNLFALDHTPDVPMDARLVVVETDGAAGLPTDASVTWMDGVGLDRSVPRRGLVVMPPAVAEHLGVELGALQVEHPQQDVTDLRQPHHDLPPR